MKSVIMDFGYLVAKGKTLYDISLPQGKAQALEILYPYFDALSSKTERGDCIGAVAEEMRIDRAAVLAEYERWQRTGGNVPKKSNLEEVSPTELTLRMNDELFLLTVVSINAVLFPEFRAAVAIREIDDPVARELFVALEECFRNDENGLESLLSRITSSVLRNFIIERGMSPEFRGDEKRDPRKLMEDGIIRMRGKKFRRRLSEIDAELRLKERKAGIGNGGDDELIAEKMYIDQEMRKLEGKTG